MASWVFIFNELFQSFFQSQGNMATFGPVYLSSDTDLWGSRLVVCSSKGSTLKKVEEEV